MSGRVLIVEDEINLQETLAYNLNRQGYEVETTGDGNDAVMIALSRPPDLILLDIMLPGIDGFEVCRLIRQELTIPIIFLTARDDEIDRVVGLEIGGDDYISKPFSMRELMARIKARLRTSHLIREHSGWQMSSETANDDDEIRTFGNIQINRKRREISLDEIPLALTPKEYDLLLFFLQNQGRTISREDILKEVWGDNFDGDIRTVDVHVRWIREKIEEDPSNPVRIVTVRSVGYRFEE
jgi:DNA-binding response OmpR family regulator